MAVYDGWETVSHATDPSRIRTLGRPSGQGTVYLVRSPARVAHIERNLGELRRVFGDVSRSINNVQLNKTGLTMLAQKISEIAADDPPEHLGALKLYKMPEDDPEEESRAHGRLQSEINVLQNVKHPAVLKLHHANIGQRFIVTEYHQCGSLDANLHLYRGNVVAAVQAFARLLDGVTAVHNLGVIHRDIKLANIFVTASGELVLGDFGIVFLPEGDGRLTKTIGELVGSHYWMPPWSYEYERIDIDKIKPTFDIYPLAKVMWSMISGKAGLSREGYRKDVNNLEKLFPNEPLMTSVNQLLGRCLVEEEKDCLPTIHDLRSHVSQLLEDISNRRGERPSDLKVPWRCRVCGRGHYISTSLFLTARPGAPPDDPKPLALYGCTHCGHIQLFAE